ncbi:MAG: hypothetical protein ACFE9L_21530 [Candidatus Hodarchaeota archaeon]
MRQFLRRVKEVSKFIRRGPSLQDVIKVCPICLSPSLEVQPSFLTFLTPTIYYCRQCNYNGPILAEIEKKEYEKLYFKNPDWNIEQNPVESE